MPIYEYVCEDCDAHFERIVLNKEQEIACPKCASKEGQHPTLRLCNRQRLQQWQLYKVLHVFLWRRLLLRWRLRLPLKWHSQSGLCALTTSACGSQLGTANQEHHSFVAREKRKEIQ
jgi:putative FmdB family regulatory protein